MNRFANKIYRLFQAQLSFDLASAGKFFGDPYRCLYNKIMSHPKRVSRTYRETKQIIEIITQHVFFSLLK